MASSFGWMDTDESQRRKVLEIVELFKEEGTVDELGIGSIRDTFANALFPGTSVLHTRLRYVLFIPWLLARSAKEATPEDMAKAMRRHEISLIDALLKNDQQGVIGQQARRNLKRFPSAVYWAQMAEWEIRTGDGGRLSMSSFYRHAHAVRSLNRRALATDDVETRDAPLRLHLDPELPPPPDDLLTSTTFDLTSDEECFLSTKIAEATEGSLLSWLITNQPALGHDYVWELEHSVIGEMSPRNQRLIDQGRRFHSAIHGASLLYNLLLSEATRSEEGIEHYRLLLEEWKGEMSETRAMEEWSRVDFWATVTRENPRLPALTRQFVDSWLDIIVESTDVADDPPARSLIKNRELGIKRGRARLANPTALDDWRGASGLVRLDYRWGVTQRLLSDLFTAREMSAAA
ncbi:DUF6361 family protein [Dietzia cinnamea]|uniref:DUF6361 family protein n=1 Tax=Dietzia cinnamea TaxID=321318 RepID=UPI0021A8B376|nr:DUF6361 family protein [Dietzia cinnamea]MCT1884721.1 DUF6361 family protein [Dietzia cinnamea]